MLQRALDVAKNWLSSFQQRRAPIYQPTSTNESPRLRTFATPTDESNLVIETESQYGTTDAASASPLVKRTYVQQILGAQFSGWRFGALHFATWALFVFLINITVTIWGSFANSIAPGVLMDGDCKTVKMLNTSLHVFINILSTVLLSGSNYCMQVLSAPTRKEVDEAHAKGRFLSIGVPSIRNILSLGRKRIVLWVLLGLSSVPLHLFYNSAVYGSLSANDYFAVSVSKSFIESEECLNCNKNFTYEDNGFRWTYGGDDGITSQYDADILPSVVRSLHAQRHTLERLEAKECLDAYGTIIQSNRRNLLIVAGDEHFPSPETNKFYPGSHVFWATTYYVVDTNDADRANIAYHWICSDVPTAPCAQLIDGIRTNLTADPMSWRIAQRCDGRGSRDCAFASSPVEYCLSEKAEPHCRLSFNTGIAAIVTALNFMKAALMFYVAFRVRDEPLVTMGDAVASFLEAPDPCTKDMCLLSAREVRKHEYRAGARQWRNQTFKWKDVTSKVRSFSTLVLFSLALALVSFLLNRSIIVLENDELRKFSTLVHLGLGAIDPRTAINGVFPNELLTNVLVANSPQVVLSILYFLYNGVFTSFLLSKEWASYAHERKGLRVSQQPSGAQRSTYFLQLPYRFSIPMMVLSGTMHWLLSQSIFLIAIDMYDWTGQPGAIITSHFGNYIRYHYKTCGYSPIAIICVLILGGIMILAFVAFGCVPYKRGMPLAGSCSLAISAACHLDGNVDPEGSEAAVEKLKWGVVAYGDDGVGHCSFSTGEVGAPIEGRMYA